MRTKVTNFLWGLLVSGLLIYPGSDIAQAEGIDFSAAISLSSEVVGINREDRTLLLKNPDGEVYSVKVPEIAQNFDQIEVKDTLKVNYHASVALYLVKTTEQPSLEAGAILSRSDLGEKPAGVVAQTIDVSAMVMEIDREKRSVTLELPDGKKVTTRVNPSVKAFETLKKGDSVHVRYTQALAVSVERL